MPNLSVFDFNANFPLNIQRTEITTSTLPFKKELLDDLTKEFIAHILVETPIHQFPNTSTKNRYLQTAYYGRPPTMDVSFWTSSNEGLGIFFDPYLFRASGTKTILGIFHYDDEDGFLPNVEFAPQDVAVGVEISVGGSLLNDLNDSMLLGYGIASEYSTNGKSVFRRRKVYENTIGSSRLLISKKIISDMKQYKQYAELHNVELLDFIDKKINVFDSDRRISEITERNIMGTPTSIAIEWEDQNWTLLRIGECPPQNFNFQQFANKNPEPDYSQWPCMLTEWYFQEDSIQHRRSVFAQIWEELIQTTYIPYDLGERERILGYAYKELMPYIESYNTTKELIRRERIKRLEE
jgi:hypothetical protein